MGRVGRRGAAAKAARGEEQLRGQDRERQGVDPRRRARLQAAQHAAQGPLPPAAQAEDARQGARKPSASDLAYGDAPLDQLLGRTPGMERRPPESEAEARLQAVEFGADLTDGSQLAGTDFGGVGGGVGAGADLAAGIHDLATGDLVGGFLHGLKGGSGTYELLEQAARKVGPEELLESTTGGAWAMGLGAAAGMAAFAWEGLKSIGEAHEAGDRDARIRIYAQAFADGFLEAASANPGAVTAEEREALAKGLADGRAAAGRLGESAPAVGKLLVERFGSEDNLRRAIVDALTERAGIHGVTTHREAAGRQ